MWTKTVRGLSTFSAILGGWGSSTTKKWEQGELKKSCGVGQSSNG